MVTMLATRSAATSTVPRYSQIGLMSRGHCHHAEAYHRVSVIVLWYRYMATCRAMISDSVAPRPIIHGSQPAA